MFRPFLSLLYGLRFKHLLVYCSALTALATYIFQPLGKWSIIAFLTPNFLSAGSIFQIQQRAQTESIPFFFCSTLLSPKLPADTVTITKSIGLIQDFDQLTAFAASAGYVEAAVYNNLTAPPFTITENVNGGIGWAIAEFVVCLMLSYPSSHSIPS